MAANGTMKDRIKQWCTFDDGLVLHAVSNIRALVLYDFVHEEVRVIWLLLFREDGETFKTIGVKKNQNGKPMVNLGMENISI